MSGSRLELKFFLQFLVDRKLEEFSKKVLVDVGC